MNEWQMAFAVSGGMIAFLTLCFGVFWKIIQDVKKSCHARIDRMDEASKDFVKNGAFNRVESAVEICRTEIVNNFVALNTRIDTLILAINGGKERK